jgi:hypothetical protein
MGMIEAVGSATDNAAIARRVGGQVFLMMAFTLFLLLLVTFFLIAHHLYAITIRYETLLRPVVARDYPSFWEDFAQQNGLLRDLKGLLAGGAAFCILGWWNGRRTGQAICEGGRKPVQAGSMGMILPAIGASVINFVVLLLLNGELNGAFMSAPKDKVIYPFLLILSGLLTMAMPMGMLAGYLTRVLGLRKIAQQLETNEMLDRVHLYGTNDTSIHH